MQFSQSKLVYCVLTRALFLVLAQVVSQAFLPTFVQSFLQTPGRAFAQAGSPSAKQPSAPALKPTFVPQVVASVPYLADLISEVTCRSSEFQVETVIAAGADPHTYSLTPAQRSRLSSAHVVVAIGSGFEPWLSKLLPSKNAALKPNAAQWLFVTDHMKLKSMSDEAGGHSAAHGAKHGAKHDANHDKNNGTEVDPHIWQSPELTLEAAGKIANVLKKVRPDLATQIDGCSGAFANSAKKAFAVLKERAQKLPASNRVIATNHDAMGYFADALGFKIVSIVGVSTEAAPTPQQLKTAVLKVRKGNVKAIFLETSAAKTAVESLARETGVKLGGTLYADGLGESGSGANTTLQLWNKNFETLFSALQ